MLLILKHKHSLFQQGGKVIFVWKCYSRSFCLLVRITKECCYFLLHTNFYDIQILVVFHAKDSVMSLWQGIFFIHVTEQFLNHNRHFLCSWFVDISDVTMRSSCLWPQGSVVEVFVVFSLVRAISFSFPSH